MIQQQRILKSVQQEKQQRSCQNFQMPCLTKNFMYHSSITIPVDRKEKIMELDSRVHNLHQQDQMIDYKNDSLQGPSQQKRQNAPQIDSFMSEIYIMQKKVRQFQAQVQNLRHQNRTQKLILNQKDGIIDKLKYQSLNINKQVNDHTGKIQAFKQLQQQVFSFLGEVDIISRQLPGFYQKEKNYPQHLKKTLKILKNYKEQNNSLKQKVKNLNFEITLKQNNITERLFEKKQLQDKIARFSQFNFQLQAKISQRDQQIQSLNRKIDLHMRQKLQKQLQASRFNRRIQEQTKYLKTQIKNITQVVKKGNKSHQRSEERSKKKYQQALEQKKNIVKALQIKIRQLQETLTLRNEHIEKLELTLQRHTQRNSKLYSMAKQFSEFCERRESIRNIGKAKENRMDRANILSIEKKKPELP